MTQSNNTNNTIDTNQIKIQDPFHWMESPNWQVLHPKNKQSLSDNDQKILEYIDIENKYAKQQLQTENTDNIFNKIWKTIPNKNTSVISTQSNIIYYQKFKKTNEYPILQIQKFKTRKTKRTTILDFNKYAHNHKFFKIVSVTASKRQQILSYAIDTIGNQKYTRYFYDIQKRKHLLFTLKEIPASIQWLEDSFLYQTYNESMRANKIFLESMHNLKQNIKSPQLIYEEKNPNVYISISRSYKRKYLLLCRSISDTNEYFITTEKKPTHTTKWHSLLPMQHQIMYSISTHHTGLYITINDTSMQYRVLFIKSTDIPGLLAESEVKYFNEKTANHKFTEKNNTPNNASTSDDNNKKNDTENNITSHIQNSKTTNEKTQHSINKNSIINHGQTKIFYKYAKEIIAHNDELAIENISITRDYIAINYIDSQGLPVIKIAHLNRTNELHTAPLPNKICSAYAYAYNNQIYYHYQSLNCPARIYKLKNLPNPNKKSNKSDDTLQEKIIEQSNESKSIDENQSVQDTNVNKNKNKDKDKIKTKLTYKSKYKFNDKDYIVKRIYVKNGNVNVPVTILHKKNIAQKAKLLLNGYGAYGISYNLFFDNNRRYLLDQNWIIGYAHIRGGGELGDSWYYDGYMSNKKNTFVDFSAVISHLIKNEYTSYEKLCITGGSAGGLVVGNAVIDHPQIKAAMALSPFLTPLYTMLNAELPLTPGEYSEWGNPSTCQKTYEYIKSYDPYLRLQNLLKKHGIESTKTISNTEILNRYNEIYNANIGNNNIDTNANIDNINTKKNQQVLPNIYINAALADPLVTYWEPLKYIAMIRELQKHLLNNKQQLSNLSILNMETNTSHQGKSGIKQPIYDLIKRINFMEQVIK